MPINRIVATKRGKAAVAIAVAAGLVGYGAGYASIDAQKARAMVARGETPPAVSLAIDKLIKPWEGIHLKAYKDIVGVWTICWGETKGVKAGMTKTRAECDAMLNKRVSEDYYVPLVNRVSGYLDAPISVQAAMVSLAYNVGSAGASNSTAARQITKKNYRAACEAITAWNKAGGKVVKGLVNRREMGDASRMGEAELCVSGLK